MTNQIANNRKAQLALMRHILTAFGCEGESITMVESLELVMDADGPPRLKVGYFGGKLREVDTLVRVTPEIEEDSIIHGADEVAKVVKQEVVP